MTHRDTISLTTHGEEETLEFGRRLGASLPAGTVLALHGDLGAGKTVLSRGIAQGLGIVEAVTSPTFTVVQEYLCSRPGRRYLYHLDMYRIDDDEAALAFGIDDFLYARDAIVLVEWPERIAGLLEGTGEDRFQHLWLDYGEDAETRRITLSRCLFDRLTSPTASTRAD